MDVKVIGPIKEYLKTFNTPDEFNLWYAKNKDEIDKITTHKLNKMYYIDGYRITKIKGVLCLKKAVKKPVDDDNSRSEVSGTNESDIHHSIDEIKNDIEQLKNDIISIKTVIAEQVRSINEIISSINGD